MTILFLAFAGCSDTSLSALTATEELTLSAASTKEEVLLDGEDAAAAAMPEHEAPTPMGECDAFARFQELQASYDTDGDGTLSATEEEAVIAARGDRGSEADRHLQGLWHMLGLVYDLDESRSLDDTERAALFDDMTVRCDALQAKLVEEFDADGDGALSEEELATATEAMEAAFEEGREGTCPEGEMGGERPEGDSGERPEELGPPPALEGDTRAVPPPFADFDTDGDGVFSDAELATLRETVREQIRSGEPLVDSFRP